MVLNLQDLPFAAFSIDDNAKIVEVNTLALELSGYSEADLKGKNVEKLIPQLSILLNIDIEENARAFDPSVIVTQTLTLIHSSKALINIDVKFRSNHSAHILYLEVNASDTLAMSSSLDNVEDKEAHVVLSSMLKPFWEWDILSNSVFYSPMAMKLLGYKQEAYDGPASFFEKHLKEEVLANIYAQLKELLSGEIDEYDIEYPLTRKDGREIWVRAYAKITHRKNGKPSHVFGTLEDITKHICSIQELKTQSCYLALTERISHSGQWRINFSESHIYWSLGVYAIYGMNPLHFMPKLNAERKIVLTGKSTSHLSCFDQALQATATFHYKTTISGPFGEALKVEIIGDVELDPSGNVIGIFGVIRDITISDQTLEKLKLLAMVNYTINVPIFFINEDDDIVYQDLTSKLSDKFSDLFGYINLTVDEYINIKNKAKVFGQVKESNISFDQYESVYDLSVTFEPDEGIYIWIVDNITQQFKQEQQQAISNRLALLGNTFGSVSHDINNVLGVALGSIEMLELKMAKGDSNIQDYVERVKNAIDKGKNVTERLLAFTRKTTVKDVVFDPNKDIEDNKYIFEQLLANKIKFTLNVAAEQCNIRFPQGEFINILLNLVLNAQDAVYEKKESGRIDISTEVNDERFFVHVNDNGVGIKPENITKIFDPFYTSKTASKGNGIGLANVYNTMYKHHGDIKVDGSGKLGGAHFTLCFNRVNDKESSQEKPIDSNSFANKTVLILDDESSIAEFVAMVVEQKGANVQYVSTKAELIDTLENLQACDVFITDMFMPELTGREASELVLTKFPNAKILSMSGYVGKEEKDWHYPLLRKPFNSKELMAFVDI